jgi:hypothetical protein
MDSALNSLLSWQFILFSLGVFVATWVIRTIVEYFIPKAANNNFWESLCLPLFPVIFGTLMAYFATKYAYPDGLTSLSGRLLFGSVAGLFSSSIYKITKGMLKDKIQSLLNQNNSSQSIDQNTQVIPFPDPHKGK